MFMRRSRAVLGRTLLALGILSSAGIANATLAYRNATIENVQGESANRVGYESISYIKQSGGWSVAVGCDTTWAYFNAKDNPHFVAIILTAKLTDAPLQVYVDDSKPKLGNICQIVNIQM